MLLGRLCNAIGENVQSCYVDCAISPGRLCSVAKETGNVATETVQCCQGDCATLLGRLCNAAREIVQCSLGDSAMLPDRLE